MHDIDLIPQSYRQALRAKRYFGRFLIGCVALISLIALTRIALTHFVDEEKSALATLQQGQRLSEAQRARLQELTAKKKKFETEIKVLSNLRGSTTVHSLFVALDRALNQDVWFDELQFMREGEVVPATPETRASGYFIIVAEPNRPAENAWRVRQHVEVRGQARTHLALTEFISQLSAQPNIGNVRLLNTASGTLESAQVVNFTLIAVIDRNSSAPL